MWCLFWNNRFYTRAIRDLGRLKEPKSKWTRSVLETCQRKAHPFSNAGAFYAQPDCTGQVSGNGSPDASARKPEYDPHGSGAVDSSLWAIYRYRYGEAELMRYLGTGIALARRPCLFPALSGFRRKRGNSAERLDRLSESRVCSAETECGAGNRTADRTAAGAGGNHGTGRNRSGESKTADCGKRVRQRAE